MKAWYVAFQTKALLKIFLMRYCSLLVVIFQSGLADLEDEELNYQGVT